ncbi:hypothetical protein HDU84_009370 [Entophlyctis sp. JEL0112]|nr:hypothetical protein HDU84_009370 [Entophlyctis sp. JEL0112]
MASLSTTTNEPPTTTTQPPTTSVLVRASAFVVDSVEPITVVLAPRAALLPAASPPAPAQASLPAGLDLVLSWAAAVPENNAAASSAATNPVLASLDFTRAKPTTPSVSTSSRSVFSLGRRSSTHSSSTYVPASLIICASIVADPATSSVLDVHFLKASGNKIPPTKSKAPSRKSISFDFGNVETRDLVILALKGIGVPCREYDELLEIPARKPVLFFVNPFGGVKEAVSIFTSVVAPMMDLARIPYKRIDTEYKGHVQDFMKEVDVKQYSSFIAVSGDGVLHELVHGILDRSDWRAARLVPVGTIGAGSSNAMNPNLGHPFVEYGVLSIIRETSRPMDVISVTFHKSNKVVYSHLNLSWAYIADLDIESDNFRWIGREKTTLSAINRLLRLRRYRAHIGIMPATHKADEWASAEDNDMHDATKVDPPDSAAFGPPRTLAAHAVSSVDMFPIQLTPSTDCVTYLTANNAPYISTTFKASNNVGLASGYVEVTYMGKKLSRVGLISAMLNERAPDDLGAIGATSIKARGLRLDPYGWNWTGKFPEVDEEAGHEPVKTSGGGVIAISGEPFEMEPVTLEVHDKVLTVFAAPWLVEDF